MHPLPASAPGQDFATQEALEAWLAEQGIAHLARLSLGVLGPWVEAALQPQFRAASARRRLIELASVESVLRWIAEAQPSAKMRELLPRLALRFLDEQRAEALAARASLPVRLSAPEDPRTHEVHRILIALRAQLPGSLAPRTPALEALQVDPLLPGFRLRQTRWSELPLYAEQFFILPEAQLTFTPGSVQAHCSRGGPSCVHALAAIDTVLLWLRQPWTRAFGEALENLLLPNWDRTLRAMARALDESPRGAAGTEVSFRLEVFEDYGVMVTASVQPRARKGVPASSKRVSRQRLLGEYGALLSPTDARIAALLQEGPASPALLRELVDHPRLFLEDSQEKVRVERAQVGLVAEERAGSVVVTAGVDGTALPAAMLERVRRGKPDQALFLWFEGSRLLTLIEAGPDVRALLVVLHKHGNAFPPESHGALLEQLSQLSARVPVALPRSVMGESVPSQEISVLRFEALASGQVRLELRTRPLADSGAFGPGEGARDVHVRRGTGAVHAVREFGAERAAALALQSRLPLDTAEPEDAPFTFLFASAQGASPSWPPAGSSRRRRRSSGPRLRCGCTRSAASPTSRSLSRSGATGSASWAGSQSKESASSWRGCSMPPAARSASSASARIPGSRSRPPCSSTSPRSPTTRTPRGTGRKWGRRRWAPSRRWRPPAPRSTPTRPGRRWPRASSPPGSCGRGRRAGCGPSCATTSWRAFAG